jgi:hypothetical protein
MKTSRKAWLIIIALSLLACIAWLMLRSRPDGLDTVSVPDTSRGPSFEVHVEKPRIARFLFGILPIKLEAKIFGNGGYLETAFDHTSRGAKIGVVGHDRLVLSADGWDLLIETDGKGKIAPGTRLVFPIELAEVQRTLRCRPADEGTGYLHATERAGSGEFNGRFLVELAICENAEIGKVIEWPPAPLTVRGSFAGLPHGRR